MSEPKKGLGRIYHFRLNDADAAVWDEKIARSGMKISPFMRAAVIRNEAVIVGDASANKKSKAVRLPANINPDIRKAIFLLAKASNNLNQIAHRLNADHLEGVVTPATYSKILEELQRISVDMKELPHGDF